MSGNGDDVDRCHGRVVGCDEKGVETTERRADGGRGQKGSQTAEQRERIGVYVNTAGSRQRFARFVRWEHQYLAGSYLGYTDERQCVGREGGGE